MLIVKALKLQQSTMFSISIAKINFNGNGNINGNGKNQFQFYVFLSEVERHTVFDLAGNPSTSLRRTSFINHISKICNLKSKIYNLAGSTHLKMCDSCGITILSEILAIRAGNFIK